MRRELVAFLLSLVILQAVVVQLMDVDYFYTFLKFGVVGIISTLTPSGFVGSTIMAITLYFILSLAKRPHYTLVLLLCSAVYAIFFEGIILYGLLHSQFPGTRMASSDLLAFVLQDQRWVRAAGGVVFTQGSQITKDGYIYEATSFALQFAIFLLSSVVALRFSKIE